MKYFIAFIPRLFVRLFKIKHEHRWLYNGTFDGGLAGTVLEFRCLWCGEQDIR